MPQIAQSARCRQTRVPQQAPDQDLGAKPGTFEDIKYAELMCFAAKPRRSCGARNGDPELNEVRAEGRPARAVLPVGKDALDVGLPQRLLKRPDRRCRQAQELAICSFPSLGERGKARVNVRVIPGSGRPQEIADRAGKSRGMATAGIQSRPLLAIRAGFSVDLNARFRDEASAVRGRHRGCPRSASLQKR